MKFSKVILFSGAGLSAESGIKTFRDSGGLWNNYPVEDVATPEGFKRNPELVHQFYNQRRRELKKVKPNPAHTSIAKLQNTFPSKVVVITQNIDDLLERAGCREVLHIHGELLKARCLHCQEEIEWQKDTTTEDYCPHCREGKLRPAVVWFNEIPHYLERIEDELSGCDLFISIGTSGVVYPAAGFARVAKYHGAKTICFNLDAPDNLGDFDEYITGPAGETFPRWCDRLDS